MATSSNTVREDDYDAQVEDWLKKRPDPSWLKAVTSVCTDLNGGRLLDCGCGPGLYLKELRKLGYDGIGLDREMRCLKMAHQNGVSASRLVQAELPSIPFADRCFDLILVRYVVHHLPRPRLAPAFASLAACLKPNGLCVVETAFHSDLQRHFDSQIYEPLATLNSAMYPDGPEIVSAAQQAGCVLTSNTSIVRKHQEYTTLDAALHNSRRLTDEGRGPTPWLRLSQTQRAEFHAARKAILPKMFPAGRVPREWCGRLLVFAVNA